MSTEYFDTKILTVGQRVLLSSGCYSKHGWICEGGPWGACVQNGVKQLDGTWNAHEQIYLSRQGIGLNGDTYECGRWVIDEIETPHGWEKVSILSSEDYIASLYATAQPQPDSSGWFSRFITALIGK